MRALVIVHPEPQDPEDIEIVFKTSIFPTRLEPLYTLIGNYLGGYRDLYDYIAYLASDSEDWDSPLIYPGIGRYADKMEHISHQMLESQLLDLKYGLIQRGVQQVDIAGLSRYECVKETDVFLRGDMEPNVRMEDSAIGDFDMDPDLYDEIVAHRIKTRVLERLTDEPVEPAADPSTYFRRYNPDPEDIPEEDIRMLELQDEAEELSRGGMGSSNIAKQLGIDERQAIKWIQHIIDKRKEEQEQLRLRVIELYKKTGSPTKIARELEKEGIKIPRITVWSWTEHLRPTKEEREQRRLRGIELYKKTRSPTKVARELGVPIRTVIRWIKHLSSPYKEERKQRRLRGIELYKKTRSPTKVARELGVPIGTVMRWTKHLRQPRRLRRYNPDTQALSPRWPIERAWQEQRLIQYLLGEVQGPSGG